jgi:hypothetical protein
MQQITYCGGLDFLRLRPREALRDIFPNADESRAIGKVAARCFFDASGYRQDNRAADSGGLVVCAFAPIGWT